MKIEPIKLISLLDKEKVDKNDVVKWAYFAYGYLNCTGEHKRINLPKQVLYAKCFEKRGNVYYVDGAL